MTPARKGDGTGLSFPGYSEVRKGDGTVLWSAGADIPDSGVYQFDSFDSSLWTLHNYATYDSNNNRVQITPNQGHTEGQLEYDYKDIDYGVKVTYNIIVQDSGSAGFFSAQFFADGYDKKTIEDSFSNIDNAVNVNHNPDNNQISVGIISGGSSTTSDSTSYSIGTGTYNVTVTIDPSNDSATATIDDGDGNSATASITDSDVSTFVAGNDTDTFAWGGGHYSDSARKSVDSITIDSI